MSADEIREIIRQELAAFFASQTRPQVSEVDGLTEARIRNSARADLVEARARKAMKRKAA